MPSRVVYLAPGANPSLYVLKYGSPSKDSLASFNILPGSCVRAACVPAQIVYAGSVDANAVVHTNASKGGRLVKRDSGFVIKKKRDHEKLGAEGEFIVHYYNGDMGIDLPKNFERVELTVWGWWS